MKIGIFCSANSAIAPEYFEKTEALGTWIAGEGHAIVFGGCNLGLMECIARAVHQGGGTTIGVVPTIIEKSGRVSDYVDVHIACDNLSDRKDLILLHSDVLIALPGGIGTLDEVFTVLYNIGGFFNSLIALLDDLQGRGMMRGSWREHIAVADTLDDVKKIISNH